MRFGQLVAAHGSRYRHTVLALDGDFEMARNVPPDTSIEYKKTFRDKDRGLIDLPRIRRTIRQMGPDVLVTYNWGAIEWSLANRWFPVARHIHIEDGFGPEEAHRQLRRRIWTRRVALSGPHTSGGLPSKQLERLAQQKWRLPRRCILHIPNGIDCVRFAKPVEPARTHGNAIVVGTVATLRPEKNLARLIRAFAAIAAEYPHAALRLVIVGDGPERTSLETIARACGYSAQISFAGATSKPELALAGMDIFALSSDTEQMPLSVLEAMASALPIVAVGVGDVADMVAKTNRRYIAQPADDEGFRRSLGALIADRELRTELGQENRKVARERFDQGLMATRYAELFG